MQTQRVELDASPRTIFGKKARFLRREGWTPANVYGQGKDSVPIQLRTREVEHVLTHVPRSALLTLALNGSESETVMIKGLDRRATTDQLRHVDFLRVSMTERMRADIPLVFVAESPAATLRGATLVHVISIVHVECLPGNLPSHIEVDLSRLTEIDDALYLRDLAVPPDVTILDDPDEIVVKALAPSLREGDEATEEEAAASATVAESASAEEADDEEGDKPS
ncbi:MAG: large subunit ribosomal protein [Chloroflexi bacterium]|nr:large subunit ribosomal protein [Chloroflexota bacterium]